VYVAGDQYRYRDGSQPVQEAVQEDDEQQQAGHDQYSGDRHAKVGDEGGPDAPQQPERVRQGPDQHGEQQLEHAVAVPQAQVAG
jgi:hypothetical protein